MDKKKEEKKGVIRVNEELISLEEFEKMKKNQNKNTKLIKESDGAFIQRLND